MHVFVEEAGYERIQKWKRLTWWMFDCTMARKRDNVSNVQITKAKRELYYSKNRGKKECLYCSKNRDKRDRDGFWDCHLWIIYWLPIVAWWWERCFSWVPTLQKSILALVHPWYIHTEHTGRKDKIDSYIPRTFNILYTQYNYKMY